MCDSKAISLSLSAGQSVSGIQWLFFFPSLWPLCMTFIWAIVDGASLVAQTVKDPPEMQATGVDPWVGKIPWRRTWQPTLVFLPQESHGQGSLVGYSAWSHKEWDTTEQPTLSLWVGMRNKDFFPPSSFLDAVLSVWSSSCPVSYIRGS